MVVAVVVLALAVVIFVVVVVVAVVVVQHGAVERPNMWCLNMFTSKCASRHNGEHFFNIPTSKNGPNVVYFLHFDFDMCFAPQRCALFKHLDF